MARTTTSALVTYLILLAVIGTSSAIGVSNFRVTIAVIAAVIPLFVLVYGLLRRVKLLYPSDSLRKCLWKDIEEQNMLRYDENHPSGKRTANQSILSILVCLFVLLFWGDGQTFLIGLFGMATSIFVTGLLGLSLYNSSRVGVGPKGVLVPPYGVILFIFLLT